MKPARRLFISTAHEVTVTRQACEAASDSPGKTMALAHVRAAQAAFEDHDETGCLEKCRAAFAALA